MEAVRDCLRDFSLADAGRAVVGTLLSPVVRFSPLGLIVTAWSKIAEWLFGFSLADAARAVVGSLTAAVAGVRPAGHDSNPRGRPCASGCRASACSVRYRRWARATWGSLCLFNPLALDSPRMGVACAIGFRSFSLAETAQTVIGGLTSAVAAFDPLLIIKGAWEHAEDWMATFSLDDATWEIIAKFGETMLSFDPLGWVRDSWSAAQRWMQEFADGKRTFSLYGPVSDLIGSLMGGVKRFDPLSWFKGAWQAVREWLMNFDLGGAAGEVVNKMVAGISAAWEGGKAATQADRGCRGIGLGRRQGLVERERGGGPYSRADSRGDLCCLATDRR